MYNRVEYESIKTLNVADFLLVTATDIETEKLLELVSPISKQGVLEVVYEEKTYHIGRMGGYNVIHCQCKNQGALAAGSSILTITNAIQHWPCIKAVIMVGIAFGMYDEDNPERKQHIGDLLIAKEVIPYEYQKVQPNGIEFKAEHQVVDQQILDAFKIVSADWNEKNLYDEETDFEICTLLSGEKLVNNKEYRDELKAKFTTSRGGEMEGAGVASACVSSRLPWIVMKSICDFGDGNKQKHKHARQACAARLAAEACRRVLTKERSLDYLCGNEKSCFYYQYVDITLQRRLFFSQYTPECEPYYLKRNVDSIIQDAIKLKGCWVYGKSGTGKSVALTRAIMQSGHPYIFINLSSFVGDPLDEMFCQIYESICLKKDVKPAKYCGYREYANAIATLINHHYLEEEVYIFIEEIPVSEQSGDVFRQFVERLCALVINNEIQTVHTDVKFVLSSISSPIKFIPDYQKKVGSFISFLELPDWKKEELQALNAIIFGIVEFSYGHDMNEDSFLSRFDNPRDLKGVLKSLYSLKHNEISETSLAIIGHCL